VAQADYRIKVQAKQFWKILGMIQDMRFDPKDPKGPPLG
jgi:hypothetical protein